MVDKEVTRFLRDVYRFYDSPEQVNWNARRTVDPSFYQKVLPTLYKFLIKSVLDVTYMGRVPLAERTMNAIVGLSGGLDSVVTSYLTLNAMQKALQEEQVSEAGLALVRFQGLENTPTDYIVRDLKKGSRGVKIWDLQTDAKETIQSMQKNVNNLVSRLGRTTTPHPGELITRVICQTLNELGTRANAATIDTTNGTEYILGEFSVGLGYDVVILTDFWKSDLFGVGRLLRVPKQCLTTPPVNSAYSHTTKSELYFGKVPDEITPEHAFGVLDPILHWLHERKKEPEEVAERLGHDLRFVQKVSKRVENQRHRQKAPVFCTQKRRLNFKNHGPFSSKASKSKIDEMMLGHLFE